MACYARGLAETLSVCPPVSLSRVLLTGRGCLFQVPCEAGTFFNGSDCIICPAGTYSDPGAVNCTPCSPGHSSNPGAAACVLVSCPATSSGLWMVYNDVSGVEGNGSCVMFLNSTGSFEEAAAKCRDLGSGVHLVSSRQSAKVSALGTDLLSVVRAAAPDGAILALAARKELGAWIWDDGTSPANLGCGSVGCGPWRIEEPRYELAAGACDACIGMACKWLCPAAEQWWPRRDSSVPCRGWWY